jgi:transaldolase
MVGKNFKKIKIDIYADGANIVDFKKLNKLKMIKGFTTNPSLMKKNKISNYKKFAKLISKLVFPKPISFEIFTDDFKEMYEQAIEISSWRSNIYVKIPVINSRGKSSIPIIHKLLNNKIKCNVTAVFDVCQLKPYEKIINSKTDLIISVFSGRIADTGIDPTIKIKEIYEIFKKNSKIKILWASTREPYNVIQAQSCNCKIITVPTEMLSKLENFGKNNIQFSKETVKTFLEDSRSLKFSS